MTINWDTPSTTHRIFHENLCNLLWKLQHKLYQKLSNIKRVIPSHKLSHGVLWNFLPFLHLFWVRALEQASAHMQLIYTKIIWILNCNYMRHLIGSVFGHGSSCFALVCADSPNAGVWFVMEIETWQEVSVLLKDKNHQINVWRSKSSSIEIWLIFNLIWFIKLKRVQGQRVSNNSDRNIWDKHSNRFMMLAIEFWGCFSIH